MNYRILLVVMVLVVGMTVPVCAETIRINASDAAILTCNPSGNATFDEIRNCSGTSISKSTGLQYIYFIKSTSYTDSWDRMSKVGYILDTSTIPDTAVLTAGTLHIWEYLGNTYFGTTYFGFTSGTTHNASFGTDDYNSFGESLLTNIPSYHNGGGERYINYTFTPSGLSYINKTGNTTIYGRTEYDLYNNITTPHYTGGWQTNTWNSGSIYLNDVNDTKDAYLDLIYYIPSVPVADFTSNATTGYNPLSVGFTDTSENIPTSWNWSFGDGDYSELQNPAHTYTTIGNYTVILNSTNSLGSNTTERVNYIFSTPLAPAAAFYGDPVYGSPPLLVSFTDTSENDPTSWLWDFGDGSSENNTQQNPIHTFTTAYNSVSLTATNSWGSDTETKANYVTVITSTYGSHPYMLFRNISEVPGFQHREEVPWSTYEIAIKSSADGGSTLNSALWYHICSNSGGAGCTNYANTTITNLYNLASTSAERTSYAGEYAIAYDLIAGTKDTGDTTLTSAIDETIRDKFAGMANKSVSLAVTSNPTDINVNEILFYRYYYVWIISEVLHDYDTTGKNLQYGVSDWNRMGGYDTFVLDEYNTELATTSRGYSSTPGMTYWYINKSGGQPLQGSYEVYYGDLQSRIPLLYNQTHGNIFTAYPDWEKYWVHPVYMRLPNGYQPNLITNGNTIMNFWISGIEWLSPENRAYSRYSNAIALKNYNNALLPYSKYDGISSFVKYLTQDNLTSEPYYHPSDKNWLTPTYVTFRTAWNETCDFISTYTQSISVPSNRFNSNTWKFSTEYYSHGDLVIADMGELKHTFWLSNLSLIYTTKLGHNTIQLVDPTGTACGFGPTYGVLGGSSWINSGSDFQTQIGSSALGYTEGTTYSRSRGAACGDSAPYTCLDGGSSYPPYFRASCTERVWWTRKIVTPENEYMVVIDRVNSSSVDWIYKNFWSLTSFDITPTTCGSTYCPLLGKNTANGYVHGDLIIGSIPFDWDALETNPRAVDKIAGVQDGTADWSVIETYAGNSDTISWNTINPYGDEISTKMFTAPVANISVAKWFTRVGGYEVESEVQNPHVFFSSDSGKDLYRITVFISDWTNTTTPRIAEEVPVTGNGTSVKITSPTGDKIDYIYEGRGESTFGNYQTDADFALIRENESETPFSFTLRNGTYLVKSGGDVFGSDTRLNYVSTITKENGTRFNVSGTGTATVTFYDIVTPLVVKEDGAAQTEGVDWSMDGNNLTIITSLSEHVIEFTNGEEVDFPEEPELLYEEPVFGETPTEIFNAISTTADGTLRRNLTDEPFTDIRNGVGVHAALSFTTGNSGLAASTSSGNYSSLPRFAWSGDTSSIPDNADITSAWFSVYGTAKASGIGAMGTTITDFEPADPTSLIAADFNKTNNLIYTTNVSYSSFSTTGWNNYYLTNLSAVNKEGYTSLMIRTLQDVDNDATGLAWASGQASYSTFYETSNEVLIPKLNVIYEVPETEAPIAAISAYPTSGIVPLLVSFTDISSGNATSWEWNFDGVNTSEIQDPEWAFESPGIYNVSLTVTNDAGEDTAYQEITVEEDFSLYVPKAHFGMAVVS